MFGRKNGFFKFCNIIARAKLRLEFIKNINIQGVIIFLNGLFIPYHSYFYYCYLIYHLLTMTANFLIFHFPTLILICRLFSYFFEFFQLFLSFSLHFSFLFPSYFKFFLSFRILAVVLAEIIPILELMYKYFNFFLYRSIVLFSCFVVIQYNLCIIA